MIKSWKKSQFLKCKLQHKSTQKPESLVQRQNWLRMMTVKELFHCHQVWNDETTVEQSWEIPAACWQADLALLSFSLFKRDSHPLWVETLPAQNTLWLTHKCLVPVSALSQQFVLTDYFHWICTSPWCRYQKAHLLRWCWPQTKHDCWWWCHPVQHDINTRDICSFTE